MEIIDECDDDLNRYGFKKVNYSYGISKHYLKVKKEDEEKIGWQNGEYYIYNIKDFYVLEPKGIAYLKKLLVESLNTIINTYNKKIEKVLVVGLGNSDVNCDSLGSKTIKGVFTNNKLDSLFNRQVFCLCPMIESQSGIKTNKLVKFVAKSLKVDLVILIDSLMTKDIKRLSHSIQFSSSGITPGGAVGGKNRIDETLLGCKVLSIGVPFMLNLKDLIKINKNIIVAPSDVIFQVEKTAKLLSFVINKFLYPSLNNEILELMGN